MTRRLTLVIVGTVAATLLFAGVGTLVLARLGARQQTKDDLRGQAHELAASIESIDSTGQIKILNNLRKALNVQGTGVVRFGPAGRTVDQPPPGVDLADLDLTKLRAGETLTGGHG